MARRAPPSCALLAICSRYLMRSAYNVHMLVHYEPHELYIEAARREKRFKNWPRQWKINLIEKLNPEWRDLYEEICQ